MDTFFCSSLTYPTLEEVEQASTPQLERWYKFLASPGYSAVGKLNFKETFNQQTKILERIAERLRDE